jgi:glycerol-3-phosphate acyltransferase PlsY
VVLVSLILPVAGFLCGSLMFSFWLGLLRGRDIRETGDGNPGAVNAFKAAGFGIGSLGLVLDFLKGAVPVTIGYQYFHLSGGWLIVLIIAPVFGHIFSPFLKFKGGKGIATTFGVWTGITLWQVPCLLGAFLIFTRFVLGIRRDEICVLSSLGGMVLFVGLVYRSLPLLAAALANSIVVAYRHLPVRRCG